MIATTLLPVLFLCVSAATLAADSPSKTPGNPAVMPEASRVAALTQFLPKTPCGVGRPAADRQAWQRIAAMEGASQIVPEAQRLLKQPMPKLADELYLDYSRTGNRSRYQRVLGELDDRLFTLVLAECLDSGGQFLPGIQECLRTYCGLKSWTLPAHDRQLGNFAGKTVEIDLHVAQIGWSLATIDYWLGDKLSSTARDELRRELERRVFTPFESCVRTNNPRLSWITTTNNWNAVCLAGVIGAALAEIPSPQRRAWFVAAAEKSIQSFLSGFTPDGYCSEGVGYWNYGFGHFLVLSETIRQATGGRMDLMADPRIETIARFGGRMEILPGLYPAFADCHVGSQPSTMVMASLSRRFGWGMTAVEQEAKRRLMAGGSDLYEIGLEGFPDPSAPRPPVSGQQQERQLRDWFSDAGILIVRPAPGRKLALGAALKGGHNAEHHNHNDVGSFVVALDGGTPLLDPGSEVYTARTFSSRRYESNVLNSFGHPVPRVAGQLQHTGRSAEAKVVRTEFADQADTLVLDLRAPYDHVKTLERLQRTFVFSRSGSGSLRVTDEVVFSSPQTFGDALITYEPWRQVAPDRLVVGKGSQAVEVKIDAGGRRFRIEPVEINEDMGRTGKPTRLGIELEEPVVDATVTLTISPAGQ